MIIEDIQIEKSLLEAELVKMLENRFATHRDDEFLSEIQSLKQSNFASEVLNKQITADKTKLQQDIFDLAGFY